MSSYLQNEAGALLADQQEKQATVSSLGNSIYIASNNKYGDMTLDSKY